VDRFDAMAAFVAVCEEEGFSAAAQKLNHSPSAVTRAVASIEERLGVRLLQRTTRAVTMTEAGTRYLERARRILHEIEEAEASAQAERGVPSGRLVVSAPMLFGRLHVSPLLCRFLTAHPAVIAELRLTDSIVNLVEDGIDVALRIGELEESSLIARRVGETRRVLVASPGYLAAHGTPEMPQALSSHATIGFGAMAAATEWKFHSPEGEPTRVRVSPHFLTNSADAALWHAMQGGGLTLCLSYQAAEAIGDGRLVRVLRDWEPPPRPIQFVYPTSKLLAPKVRSLIDLAVAGPDWRFPA